MQECNPPKNSRLRFILTDETGDSLQASSRLLSATPGGEIAHASKTHLTNRGEAASVCASTPRATHRFCGRPGNTNTCRGINREARTGSAK